MLAVGVNFIVRNRAIKIQVKRGSAIEVFYRGRALMELKNFFWPKTPKNMSKRQIWAKKFFTS